MKSQINNLKDYAELAQASYFYFDLLKDSNNTPRKIYELDYNSNKIKDENYPRGYKEVEITLEHIISKEYQGQEVLINLKQDNTWQSNLLNTLNEKTNFDKLNGEFSPLQAQNFVKRYKIYFHQPNTTSGFSATLFYDTQEDRFVVGFRGTENNFKDIKAILETALDVIQDANLTFGKGDFQANALKQFLLDIAPILNNADSDKIIFVGHSLGGYLAQWALIYCDSIYKDKLKFSPSEVYTFNAPSIYGWNLPSPIINPNIIKILQEILDKRSIDISDKITHIYDNGGIKLIASAQYGSINKLPIHTGKDSHAIIPITQTLYFYSYLLESNPNYNKVKNKNLEECIEYLNNFMQEVYQVFNPLSMRINNKNLMLYKTQEKRPNSTDFLATLIEHILYVTSLEKEIESTYIQLHTTKDNIIDKIIALEYYTEILDKQDIDNLDSKQCSIAEKRAIFKCQPFKITDKDGNEVLSENNIAKLFRYNSNSTKIALYNDKSSVSYFDARLSMMKHILYGDNINVCYIKASLKSNENKISTLSMSSTLYVDTQAKAIYIFANDKDYIDCDTIYKQIKQECNLQESLEELQSYKPSLFLDSHLLLGGTESPNPLSQYFFGELESNSSNTTSTNSTNSS
ncbi:lipase family protein, partial [Helicobacter sp. MIT 14-3879]|uniref:lipase family protein n=1 Tax=Helicobacter sp. MIT 14-3879 TaxID=2040649 RepID=UPI000E1EFFDD